MIISYVLAQSLSSSWNSCEVDSSYNVHTNVSVRRGIMCEALAYTIYIREKYYFSLLCTF